VYENGIIETNKGVYTKSYLLQDVNFQIASQQEQEEMFLAYSDLLNLFPATAGVQISINNRNIDIEDFKQTVLIKPQKDNMNDLREEYNNMLLNKMQEGRNNMSREKYLTVSLPTETVEEAVSQFARLDNEISTTLKKIVRVETEAMTTAERLSVLHDLYNIDHENLFFKKASIGEKEFRAFTFRNLREKGISTKDLIGPESLEFNKDYMMIGDKFARVLFLDNLPTFLSTDILPELTDVACNMLASVFYEPIAQDKGMKIIKNQIVNINSNVIDAQKRASKSGYSADLISPDLRHAQQEAEQILQDMTKRNQKLFLVTVLITHYADSLDELNHDTEALATVAQKHLCNLKKLNYQQELGFASCLPLATNRVFVKRMLTTEAASVFIPFAAQELTQKNGMYYGLNAVSKNMILFNRLNSKNPNGVILGTPGSGKSFSAKREIINVLLNTNDEVFIIDPEREYAALTPLLGGETVRIAAGARTYVNPLDMDLDYADDDDPITLKSDFIGSLCETIIGGRYGLSPIQKTVIDRCVRQVYQPYLEHMSSLKTKITYDADYMPTLIDFYELLLSQPEPEAQNIALSLELYCTGSLDTFAHKTNVNTRSRFVVYDIKDIGSGMKEMGFQVCLDTVWNKMISNKKLGKRTWLYLDEFYLLTQTESSAKFLQQIWKRARKWNGVPTGITQNVEDLLKSPESRAIISNSDFVLMLNQAPLDRADLAQMLNISPAQVQYITNADSGQGLLYTSKTIVPFIDKFPQDTKLYTVMTTKPDEVNLAEAEGRRAE
jgi:type IV secretory pathway VirB4 component